MRNIRVDDVQLQYETHGGGPPMLFIHGANLAGGLDALSRDPALTSQVRTIRYHRRGMSGSTRGTAPMTVERQAEDALGLLDALGAERAHVLGYSYGGTVALELAARAPARLLSLSLLEPILLAVPSAGAFMAAMASVNQLYAAGDVAGTVRALFEALGGQSWRTLVEAAAGPGSIERAIVDTPIFFEAEAPSLGTWAPSAQGLKAVRCPVLSVRGTASGPIFIEGRALIHSWLPECIDVDIPGATHFLHLQEPQLVARALAQFIKSSLTKSQA